MDTAVARTLEIDDLELATKELASQIKEKLQFKKNSIGIAYCDADVDIASFGALMHKELGIDIAGATTTATIERHNGYNGMGIMLAVMTADDVDFFVGSTGELDSNDYQGAIRDAYTATRAKAQHDPKLILMLAPFIMDLTSENYMEILDEMSGSVPIFGGVATDHYDLQYQKTFLNGQMLLRGLVFVLLTGKLKPVFAMEHHFGAKVEKKGVITKSTGHLVNEVDNQSFKTFISSMVPVPDEEMIVYHFQSTPFVMELPDYEKNEQPVVRAIVTMDHGTGSGGFLSKMPEGSVIYMNVFQQDNLGESCRGAMSSLISQMDENKDYKYSMIFISTCNARHLLMGDAKSLESDIVAEMLANKPASLNALGFYGFGEMCPTGLRTDGTAKNRFHNVSFAVCAI